MMLQTRQNFEYVTYRYLGYLMHEYVQAGGEIDEQRETRERWSDQYQFHYDLPLCQNS